MKKFFISLLSFIMLVCIVCFTVLSIARTMLKGNNLYDVLVAGVKDRTGSGDIKKEMVGSLIPEEGSEEIIKYINENDFNGQMGDLISSYLKYKSGVVSEKPDMEGFKEMLDEAITKYEKDTGKKVDRKKYDDALDIFEDVMDKEDNFTINDKVRDIFNIIYSNVLYYGIIAVFIICLLLILVIGKSIIVVFRSSYIVFIISGVFFFIASLFSGYLNDLDEIEMGAFKKIAALSRKSALIDIVIAVILIIVVIVLKTIEKKKKEAKKEARRLAREEKKRLEQEKNEEVISEDSEKEDKQDE